MSDSPETRALPPRPSLTRAPAGRGRRVLLVRAVEEPVNPIYFNNMSLGLLWVAAGIRARCPGAEVRVLDWNDLGPSVPRQRFNWYDHRSPERGPRFDALLAEYRPAVVAISAYSCYMPLAIDVAERVRAHDPSVPVVLGGFHATAYPESVGKYGMFDLFVRGEGVRAAGALVASLLDGSPPLDEVPSLSYRAEEGRVATTRTERAPASLDENPPVDWNDVDPASYRANRLAHLVGDWFLRFPKGKFVLYEASQGCHKGCRFCEQRVQHGARSRHFSVARVLEDLRRIRETFDCEGVFFTDEYIHGDRDWFRSLLAALAAHSSLGLKYTMAVKADEVERELVDRIVDAGFVQLSSYPESGSRRILEAMGKPIDLERHVDAMSYASDQGLLVFNGFVVGWPGETREEVEMSYRIAERDFSDHVHMLPLSYLGRAPVGRHLADIGVTPDTPEYFRLLNHPTDACLAAYGPSELSEYVDGRVKALNVAKLLSARTQAKLSRLGWETVRLPEERAGGASDRERDEVRPVPEVRTGAGRKGVSLAEGARQAFVRLVLPALRDAAYTLDEGSVTAGPGDASPRGRLLKLTLRLSGPAPVTAFLHPRNEGPCFAKTRFFSVSYGVDPPFTREAGKTFRALLLRIAAWEQEPAASGARTEFAKALRAAALLEREGR